MRFGGPFPGLAPEFAAGAASSEPAMWGGDLYLPPKIGGQTADPGGQTAPEPPKATRACLNLFTLTFRALGRNHIASTPLSGHRNAMF